MSRLARHFSVVDPETGEVLHETVKYGSQNGEGWMIVYRDAYMQLTLEAPDFVTSKVFTVLMTKQPFEGGIKMTKKAIADKLGVSRTAVWQAIKWLKENRYIKETKTDGVPEFLLNPNVTTCGKNKKAKIALWESVD